MKLSFHSFAYSSMFSHIPSYTLEETIKRIARIGYDGIEIGATRPHAWPPDLDAAERERINEILAKNNLEVAAISPNVHYANPASPIPQERLDAAQHYKECVRLAADFEAPFVVFMPGWKIYGTTYSQAWKWSLEAIKPAVELAEESNVTLAVEAVNPFSTNFITRFDQAAAMMEEIGSPNVKLLLDTINVFLGREDAVELLENYEGQVAHIHCVDGTQGSPERKILGRGEFEFEGFAKRVVEVGYSGYLSVEIWGRNPDQIARGSFEFLSNLIDSILSNQEGA